MPALEGLDAVARTAVVGVKNEVEGAVGGEGDDRGVIGVKIEGDISTGDDGSPGLAVVGGGGEGDLLVVYVARTVGEGEEAVG